MTNQEALIEAAYRWMSNNEKIVLEALSAGAERAAEKAAEAVAVQTSMRVGNWMDKHTDEIVTALSSAAVVQAFGRHNIPVPTEVKDGEVSKETGGN